MYVSNLVTQPGETDNFSISMGSVGFVLYNGM